MMASPFQSKSSFLEDYPWTLHPLIASAPMRLISGPALAIAVSQAGGLGFIGAGSDHSNLRSLLQESLIKAETISRVPKNILPIGVGFLNWGADLPNAIHVLREFSHKPAALWFFAPNSMVELVSWTNELRDATKGKTKIWIQVGTVNSALDVAQACKPDVLVIQGSDAGGHGLAHSASIISLLPEVADALSNSGFNIPLVAAGGIMDARGVAAAIMLGASGVCMGTRFLASFEAEISQGYRKAVLDAHDGGVATVRTSVYDKLRGTTGWPEGYNGRGLINKSFRDWESGLSDEENMRLYEEALHLGDSGWGKDSGRITTYAGTGVGLARDVLPAGKIVEEVVRKTTALLERASASHAQLL